MYDYAILAGPWVAAGVTAALWVSLALRKGRDAAARRHQNCRSRIDGLAERIRREHADWYR